VITIFLRSLTENWHGQLNAVIVFGYDGDGAAALCGIREVGGITIARHWTSPASPTCLRAPWPAAALTLRLNPRIFQTGCAQRMRKPGFRRSEGCGAGKPSNLGPACHAA
jgi:hypothetical protein